MLTFGRVGPSVEKECRGRVGVDVDGGDRRGVGHGTTTTHSVLGMQFVKGREWIVRRIGIQTTNSNESSIRTVVGMLLL